MLKSSKTYVTGATAIAGSVSINRYKKRARGNWNSATTGMVTVNAYENEVDQVDALEGDTRFLDFEDDDDDI